MLFSQEQQKPCHFAQGNVSENDSPREREREHV